MSKKKYRLAVCIGRFQPLHLGHNALFQVAAAEADTVLVLIGSSNVVRNPENPFTFEERALMIRETVEPLVDSLGAKLVIRPLRDTVYNEDAWLAQVQDAVSKVVGPFERGEVGLFGHDKDETSYYLHQFPQFVLENVPDVTHLSATHLREHLLFRDDTPLSHMEPYVGPQTLGFLESFQRLPAYAQLVRESAFLESYRKPFESLKYPVIFVTTDAVVSCNGHLLVVERRAEPGRGLLALPGGFLGVGERILDSAVRELREETRLKVPEKVLLGSLVGRDVFDAPRRSLRGRTVTHAFHFSLDGGDLPRVKGDDDARKAYWLPFSEFRALDGRMFEDHWHIAAQFLGFS